MTVGEDVEVGVIVTEGEIVEVGVIVVVIVIVAVCDIPTVGDVGPDGLFFLHPNNASTIRQITVIDNNKNFFILSTSSFSLYFILRALYSHMIITQEVYHQNRPGCKFRSKEPLIPPSLIQCVQYIKI